MSNLRTFLIRGAAGAALAVLAACGGDSDAATSDSTGGGGDTSGATQLSLTGNDQMQYDKNELTAPAGTPIQLTLENIGEQPKIAMGHNVVVLEPGTDPVQFSQDVTTGGGTLDNNYLPEDMKGPVIAATKILGPGESATIEFTIDEPGEYPYVCTFPAHAAAGMKGVLTIE